MPDIKQVLYDIERCTCHVPDACRDCSKYRGIDGLLCMEELMADAYTLLKKQKEERKEEQSDWISVKERMPVELHSIFWPWYGKKEWRNAMWREQSDKVLVTVAFKDGTRFVTTGETHDGIWHTAISRTLDPIVTHWMSLPEPPENVVQRDE